MRFRCYSGCYISCNTYYNTSPQLGLFGLGVIASVIVGVIASVTKVGIIGTNYRALACAFSSSMSAACTKSLKLL